MDVSHPDHCRKAAFFLPRFHNSPSHSGGKPVTPSQEEVAAIKWPPNPEEFDTDRDGVLTLFEIASRFAANRQKRREWGVMGTDHSYAIQIMNRYDQDKDRQLDDAEARKTPIPRDRKAFDENKDRKFNLTELGRLISADRVKRGILTTEAQRARLLVSRFDRNSDGQLDDQDKNLEGPLEAEANIAAASIWPADLDESDADKNGRVTVRELENYYAQMRRQAAIARGVTRADETSAAQLLFRYDTNRNRRVDIDETENPPVGVAEITILTFVEFDEDFDEQLSQAELAKFVSKRRYEENVTEKSK